MNIRLHYSVAVAFFMAISISYSYAQNGEEPKIINVGFPGIDEVICLSEEKPEEFQFETEGDFPEDVVFTLRAVFLGLDGFVELGQVAGKEATSIPVSWTEQSIRSENALFYVVAQVLDPEQTIAAGEYLYFDLVTEVDPSITLNRDGEVVVRKGQTIPVSVSRQPGVDGNYFNLVHEETGNSVSGWQLAEGTATFRLEDPEPGTYNLYGRGVGENTGQVCQDSVETDGSFMISRAPAEITNLHIPGLEDNTICFDPEKDYEVQFDVEGELPEDAQLRVDFSGVTYGGTAIVGNAEAEEGISSIDISFPENMVGAAEYAVNVRYTFSNEHGDHTVVSDGLLFDLITPIDLDDIGMSPEGLTEIESDEVVEGVIFLNSNDGYFFNLVHEETEESATDGWVRMFDTPLQFRLEGPAEGTYRLYVMGASGDTSVVCEDSVRSDAYFIIEHAIEEEPQIINVNIPGVEDILCRDDAPDYIEFETLGDFPEGTTFRAFMVTEERTIPLGHPAELNANRINVPFWPTRPNEDVEIFISATNGDLEVESERLMITYFSATEETVDYQVRNRGGDVIEPVNGQYFLCEGERFTLYLHSIKGATYRWYRNGEHLRDIGERVHAISVDQSGVYTLKIILEHCPDIVKERNLVFVEPLDNVEITAVGNVLKAPEALNYQWFRDGEPLEGETERTHTAEVEGSYTVELITQGGCEATSEPYRYTVTSVGNALAGGKVSAYPNPVSDRLHIEADISEEALITVTGMEGQVVHSETIIGSTNIELDVSLLSAGVYLVNITSSGESYTFKIIKQ
ncbi:T9SS type A sorting domain-containing protein [Cytophagaceae bacterium ABcell3]|nr:T9SS type A sorting domain-containing protein [Cytophagaceae bacterium ABcell3]